MDTRETFAVLTKGTEADAERINTLSNAILATNEFDYESAYRQYAARQGIPSLTDKDKIFAILSSFLSQSIPDAE